MTSSYAISLTFGDVDDWKSKKYTLRYTTGCSKFTGV